jgi:hypothetical protein
LVLLFGLVSCGFRAVFFDVVDDGGVGLLLPLATPEWQWPTGVQRVKYGMEGSCHRVLRHFRIQSLALLFGFAWWIPYRLCRPLLLQPGSELR